VTLKLFNEALSSTADRLKQISSDPSCGHYNEKARNTIKEVIEATFDVLEDFRGEGLGKNGGHHDRSRYHHHCFDFEKVINAVNKHGFFLRRSDAESLICHPAHSRSRVSARQECSALAPARG
jgi:hypothetical protein